VPVLVDVAFVDVAFVDVAFVGVALVLCVAADVNAVHIKNSETTTITLELIINKW
jgi:hypothetical protein